jgi:CheY-like chemotaxis protein
MINLNDQVQENVQEIIRTADRAARLTRQLLAFSRRQIIEPMVINMNHVIERMDLMLKRVIGEDIALKVETDPDIRNIMADPTQVEQLIVNLAVNARDAMPRGGELKITTSNLEDTHELKNDFPEASSGEYVMLSVSDTGTGIDPEVLERVFEPFFTTKGEEGTGLGLSTVYGIIRQNNGYVRVHSVRDEGTSFLIIFPVTEGDIQEATEERFVSQEQSENRETILVVEDEDSVRKMIVRSLKQAGYDVQESAGGREALKACREMDKLIHLIITDVVMPEMSGPEFVSRVEQFLPSVQVLFMSGYTEDAIVDRNVLKPDVNFISKPFGPGELTRRVREILDS